jgi:hypothetical protein
MDHLLGTFEYTDATGIPSTITIKKGTARMPRAGVFEVPTLELSMHKCGMAFGILIRIIEPEGPAPIFESKPLGLSLVRAVLDHVQGIDPPPGAPYPLRRLHEN